MRVDLQKSFRGLVVPNEHNALKPNAVNGKQLKSQINYRSTIGKIEHRVPTRPQCATQQARSATWRSMGLGLHAKAGIPINCARLAGSQRDRGGGGGLLEEGSSSRAIARCTRKQMRLDSSRISTTIITWYCQIIDSVCVTNDEITIYWVACNTTWCA